MSEKGVVGVLFDLSFSEFVTTRVIRFLFVVGCLFAAVGSISLIVGGFHDGFLAGIMFLLFSPVVFLFMVLGVRIWCEMIIVMFRIAENTSRIAEKQSE
jgi:uncharacterized membrane protein YhaH (DUF805 family)